MSSSNNYSNNTSSNRLNIPQACQAMDQFKMQDGGGACAGDGVHSVRNDTII